ncbi:hypothetical protein F5884DRAFT_278275 [Xylogone sp. PMI_703]|nr:hypothetical protein F5884DRAFT_278275 [Xylogone sp. PMI_703]
MAAPPVLVRQEQARDIRERQANRGSGLCSAPESAVPGPAARIVRASAVPRGLALWPVFCRGFLAEPAVGFCARGVSSLPQHAPTAGPSLLSTFPTFSSPLGCACVSCCRHTLTDPFLLPPATPPLPSCPAPERVALIRVECLNLFSFQSSAPAPATTARPLSISHTLPDQSLTRVDCCSGPLPFRNKRQISPARAPLNCSSFSSAAQSAGEIWGIFCFWLPCD